MSTVESSSPRTVWDALLIAGCAAAAALIAAGLRPLLEDTYWWHVAVGEFITTWQRIPEQQLFLFTVEEIPWVYDSWLGSVVLSELHRMGGAGLSMLATNLSVAVGVGIAVFSVARHTTRRASLITAAVVAALLGAFVATEPYALAVPLAAAAVAAVFTVWRRPDAWWAAAVIPLSVLVAINIDFATALAIAYVGLIACVEIGFRTSQSERRMPVVVTAALSAAGIPALFGFAYGPTHWPVALDAMFSGVVAPVPLAVAVFAAALVAAVAVARADENRLCATQATLLAVVISTAVLVLVAPSTLGVFAVAAALAIAAGFDAMTRQGDSADGEPVPAQLHRWRAVLALVVLTGLAVLLQPGVATRAPLMNAIYDDVRTTAPLAGSMPDDLPLRCAEELHQSGRLVRLFHDPDHAGFLLYHLLDPERPHVFLFDDHRDLVDDQTAMRAEVLQSEPAARGLFVDFGINAAVIDRNEYAEVADELDEAPDWYDLRENRDEQFGCFVTVASADDDR